MDNVRSTTMTPPNRIIYYAGVGGHPNSTSDLVTSGDLMTTLNATDGGPSQQRDQQLLRIEIAVQAAIFCLAVLGKGDCHYFYFLIGFSKRVSFVVNNIDALKML